MNFQMTLLLFRGIVMLFYVILRWTIRISTWWFRYVPRICLRCYRDSRIPFFLTVTS
eukprot:UN16370